MPISFNCLRICSPVIFFVDSPGRNEIFFGGNALNVMLPLIASIGYTPIAARFLSDGNGEAARLDQRLVSIRNQGEARIGTAYVGYQTVSLCLHHHPVTLQKPCIL